MREFSLAKTQQRLSHLSVGELFRLLGEDSAQILKEGLRALPGKVKDAGEGEGEGRGLDATDSFGYWLQQQDAYPIDDQGAWFTEAGEFDSERFKAHLDKQKLKVDSLEDLSALADWGHYLKQMIFEDSARKRLRLFDHSPQARLIRCLTPPQSNIYINASAKAPDIGSAPDFRTRKGEQRGRSDLILITPTPFVVDQANPLRPPPRRLGQRLRRHHARLLPDRAAGAHEPGKLERTELHGGNN